VPPPIPRFRKKIRHATLRHKNPNIRKSPCLRTHPLEPK
jgi:hypothetical protein